MKKIFYILVSGLILISSSSCSDFLDVVPDDVPRIDNAFTLRSEAEKYLFTCYSYMPRHASPTGNPAFLAGDEIWVTTSYRDRVGAASWRIANGEQNAGNPYSDYWRGNNVPDMYQAISDCNIFLENIDKVPDMTYEEKNRWIAEVQFLKAYYHFTLIRSYGPIVIKDINVPINAPTEDIHPHRQTLDSCFNYVTELLDKVIASTDLPDRVSNEAEELGRITKAIAYAIKAEVLVFAASDLYNGNRDYKDIKDNRGIAIFSPDKSDTEKKARWADARNACRQAIDFAHGLDYKLYYYTDPEFATASDSIKTKLNIRNAVTLKWNTEVIWGNSNQWGSSNSVGTTLDLQGWPRGLDPTKGGNTTYAGNHGVTMKVAEQFYTRNGLPIDKDNTWDFANRFNIRTSTVRDGLYIYNGYKTAEFNFDREPRYYADLGFDGCIYFGFGNYYGAPTYPTHTTPLYVQAKSGQPASSIINTSFNVTGIWPKKLVNFKSSIGANSGWTCEIYPWPVVRLSNLYLYFAEALNEAEDSEAARLEAIEYLNRIRERAGIPDVATSWETYSTEPTKHKSQVGLREIIRRERLIEMAFEGCRFWDLRRWKQCVNLMNAPITGWTLEGDTPETYYIERQIAYQVFQLKDYFWPIYKDELYSNPNLVQNYGW